MKFTIITPVFNGEKLLTETIESIKNQSYHNIEYIIIDGGSTDGTIDLIKKYPQTVNYFISEKDNGMYDALAKGLELATGDIIGYLNAGDLLYENALEVVSDVMSKNNVDWLTGYRSVCNDHNIITRVELPFRYKRGLVSKGVYGKLLPYIQQESTFWSRELNSTINLAKLRQLKLAGDYFLWFSFSKRATLEIVKSPLGIFKVHEGQQSEHINDYWNELSGFVDRKSIFTCFEVIYELFFWGLDANLRSKFFKNIWFYDLKKKNWTLGKR
ncbi:glycosyltransferase family 2 protein [Thiomicrorhabdus sp.]|uniref:glycosyltransferase family 2 protein n=1 Tax=Thiomicrorhabdus sp. TaxID=2039724 RepID=UPI002AA6384D|nr:glycosyltransferase family 2 protein [Thiomicrorhabdus sp.]